MADRCYKKEKIFWTSSHIAYMSGRGPCVGSRSYPHCFMLTKTQNMGTTTKINPESSPLVLFVRIEMLIMQFYSGLII